MSPMQQMLLGAGVKNEPTYIEDVFSVDLWKGNGTDNRAVTTNVDMTSDGGMVWLKSRNATYNHTLFDTIRGAEKRLFSNSSSAQLDDSTSLKSFTSTGFTLGTGNNVNGTTHPDFASWSWKKTKYVFDIQSWSGNGTAGREISHNLGAVPGAIIVKCLNSGEDWCVWHKDFTRGTNQGEYGVFLNKDDNLDSDNWYWDNTNPTASVFTVGGQDITNGSGKNYIAYIFGTGSSKSFANQMSTDSNYGALEATVPAMNTASWSLEGWFKKDDSNTQACIFDSRSNSNSGTTDGVAFYINSSNQPAIYQNGWHCTGGTPATISAGTWYHFAVEKSTSGSTSPIKIFINGVQSGDTSTVTQNHTNTDITIGVDQTKTTGGGYPFKGKIASFHWQDTGKYTGSFRVPDFPLPAGKNTQLLCCDTEYPLYGTKMNDWDSISEVFSGSDLVTSSIVSDIGETSGNIFGANGDENIIKCGGYVGTGNQNVNKGPRVILGWQPQFVLIKSLGTADWVMYDDMRGWVANGFKDAELIPNEDSAETESVAKVDILPNGFQPERTNSSTVNENGVKYVYIAMRGQDPYVSKTDSSITNGNQLFGMDKGTSASSIPNYLGNFKVNFALSRDTDTTSDWRVTPRIFQNIEAARTNSNTNRGGLSTAKFDTMTGWSEDGNDNTWLSWFWRRSKGHDVTSWYGTGNTRIIPHNLSVVPEMILVKNIDGSFDWAVYHSGLNGGTNPEQYWIKLNGDGGQTDAAIWNDTAPTSRGFTVTADDKVNKELGFHIAILFSSVPNYSKCGHFTGNSSVNTIETGFVPSFLMIKRADGTGPWVTWDGERVAAIGSSNNVNQQSGEMYLNATTANSGYGGRARIGSKDVLGSDEDGFELLDATYNAANTKYIYYAHGNPS